MDTNFNIIFQFILNNFGSDHMFWIFYFLNLFFSVIAYKLGFARKLPLLKSIFVYILFAIGVCIITIFSILRLPKTDFLMIISIALEIYRFRLYKERQK